LGADELPTLVGEVRAGELDGGCEIGATANQQALAAVDVRNPEHGRGGRIRHHLRRRLRQRWHSAGLRCRDGWSRTQKEGATHGERQFREPIHEEFLL
jgi:hypothetical protein